MLFLLQGQSQGKSNKKLRNSVFEEDNLKQYGSASVMTCFSTQKIQLPGSACPLMFSVSRAGLVREKRIIDS